MSGVSSPRTGHGLPVSFRVSANISSMAAMRSLKSALRLAGMGSALLDAAVFVSFCRPRLSVPCTTCISPASKSMSRTSRPTMSPRLMPDPTAARSANSMGFLGSRESTSALMPSTGGGCAAPCLWPAARRTRTGWSRRRPPSPHPGTSCGASRICRARRFRTRACLKGSRRF